MDVDAAEWCWWAQDRYGRVALFDASEGGVVPMELGYSTRRFHEFERRRRCLALLEAGSALLPRLDLDGMFVRAPAGACVLEPAALRDRAPDALDWLIEIGAKGTLHGQGWPERLCAEVEQARLRRMSWTPARYWLRAPPAWLAEHWSALGVTRALTPFAPQPADFGAFEYHYERDFDCFTCEQGPRASVLRVEQFPTYMQHRLNPIEMAFGPDRDWIPEGSLSRHYLSREEFVRRNPHIYR